MAATTTNMGLQAWDQATDIYDHAQLSSNWTKVDQHDHTVGKGKQIPTAGIEDGAITNSKLDPAIAIIPADNSVSTVKIQNAAVTEGKLDSQSVSLAKIKQESWTAISTPAWLTVGTGGSFSGSYIRIGNVVHLNIFWLLGTGGDVSNSGFPDGRYFDLPVSSLTGTRQVGSAWCRQSSKEYTGVCVVGYEADYAAMYVRWGVGTTDGGTTLDFGGPLDSTGPFNWTANDEFMASITYRV